MRISVVTVCFNSEKTLERTLKSFFEQDYPDKELIVIDGGSKDSTLQIIERYRRQIAVVVSEPDKGIYDAMNKGWQSSTGDFIHFLNSDDWYAGPQVLSSVASHLKDSRTIYHGRLIYHHEGGHRTSMGQTCHYDDLRFELRGIHQPATFFPRSLFNSLGGFDISYRISADYDLIRRFVKTSPTEFLDLDVTLMSDSGASAKHIKTALNENYRIAVHYGESKLAVKARNAWVYFWLRIRYSHPRIYKYLKIAKDRFLK